MALEIERKFLVTSEAWRSLVTASEHYRQGYLLAAEDAPSSIRVRTSGHRAWLNIKGRTVGVMRTEYEYEIPVTDADEILRHLCVGPIVEKTRYFVDCRGRHWEVDVFEGDNAGLVVAEIELASADEALDLPAWIGKEVTSDPRYYNACLVKKPFRSW